MKITSSELMFKVSRSYLHILGALANPAQMAFMTASISS